MERVLPWTLLDIGCQSRDTWKVSHLGLNNFANSLGMGRTEIPLLQQPFARFKN